MKTEILYGKPVADAYREKIAKVIAERKAQGLKTTLAIILVGDDGASQAYLKRIVKLTESLGGVAKTYLFPKNTPEKTVLECLKKLNKSKTINGIMPLFPMPKQINPNTIGNEVTPGKDLDCVNSANVGDFFAGRSPYGPATARACLATLKHYGIKLDGKHAVVIGRSNVVGKPVANLLLNENCTVTVCHSHTKNLAAITATADILVAAVGRSKFVKPRMVKEGAVLIDVGINVTPQGIVGDICPNCYKKAKAYTPVPGGIGVVSNMMLLDCLTAR